MDDFENTSLTDDEQDRIYPELERLAVAVMHDRLRHHEHCLPEYLDALHNDCVSEASEDVCDKAIMHVIEQIPNIMDDFFDTYDGYQVMGELVWVINNA